MKRICIFLFTSLLGSAAWGRSKCDDTCIEAMRSDVAAMKQQVNAMQLLVNAQKQELERQKTAAKIPVGAILPYGGGPLPEGFLAADGRRVNDGDPRFAALCQAIGDKFRAQTDPVGTCRLPDLRGRVPLGDGQGDGLTARRLGETLGEERHLLTVAELPSHSHQVNDPGHRHSFHQGTNQSVDQAIWQPVAKGELNNAHIEPSQTGITLSAAGGGQAHSIIQPSVVVRYLIRY